MTTLQVNGHIVEVTAELNTPLIWILREQLGLVSTKYGCDTGLCGACSILVNGELVSSCSFPLSAIKENDQIMTVEGISQEKYNQSNSRNYRANI